MEDNFIGFKFELRFHYTINPQFRFVPIWRFDGARVSLKESGKESLQNPLKRIWMDIQSICMPRHKIKINLIDHLKEMGWEYKENNDKQQSCVFIFIIETEDDFESFKYDLQDYFNGSCQSRCCQNNNIRKFKNFK
jgi:hypothetical protein